MAIEELYSKYKEQGKVSISSINAWHCDDHYDTPHCQEYIDEP